MAAPGSDVVDVGQRSLRQRVVITKGQVVIRSLALIQAHAAVLHAGLEGVPTARPDQVVNQAISSPNLDVGAVVVESYEVVGAHRIRESTRLRIVKGRAINVELHLVEESWTEGVLQRQHIV